MIKFLSGLVQKNKKPLLFVTTTVLAIGGGIWSLDLLKLVPTGTLPPLTQWQIRILLTLILISACLSLLLIITIFSYKKDTNNLTQENSTLTPKIYKFEQTISELKRKHSEEMTTFEKNKSQEIAELTEKYNKPISNIRNKNGKAGSGLGPHI